MNLAKVKFKFNQEVNQTFKAVLYFLPMTTEPTVQDRILALLAARGVSQRQVKPTLAQICGITYQAAAQWFSLQTNIRAEHLMAIAEHYRISVDWLLRGGSTPPPPPREGNGHSQNLEQNVAGEGWAVKPGNIPVVGRAMLGTDGYFEALEYPVGHGEGYLNIFSEDPNAYGLRVVGNSMKPRIKHNEFVVVEPNSDFVSGDEVLVKTKSGQSMIKEYIYHRDGQYRFDSVNESYDPVYLFDEEIELIHYVGAIVKGSRFTQAE